MILVKGGLRTEKNRESTTQKERRRLKRWTHRVIGLRDMNGSPWDTLARRVTLV